MSEPVVAAIRRLRRAVAALSLIFLGLLLLALAASQIEQRIFRRRAERLLADVQALELRKTSWAEAQRQFQHWGASIKRDDHCTEQRCTLEVSLKEPVFAYFTQDRTVFTSLDDYMRWKFHLSYDIGPLERTENALFPAYLVMGGRPAWVDATIGIRDGIVWRKEFWINLETFAHDDSNAWEVGYELSASARSVPRFNYYDSMDPRLLLHPNYLIGQPGGCEGCVAGWVDFTPYADSGDIRRLMQFDLSCLTRIHPCRTQQDIMPAAWSQYLAEEQQISKMPPPACSPAAIEMLGRDSANIVEGQLATYAEEKEPDYNEWRGHAGVKLMQRLKGGGNWVVGDTHEIDIFRRPGHSITPGARFILFFDERNWYDTIPYDRTTGCSPLPLTEDNLKLVAAGISQDYSADDPAGDRAWHW